MITIGLKEVLQVDGKNIDLDGLAAALNKAKKGSEKLNIIINSDRDVEVQRLVEVIDNLKQNGFESVAIATRKPR